MPARHFGLSTPARESCLDRKARLPLRGPMPGHGPARPDQVRKATDASETSHRPFWTAQIAACVRFLTPILRRITFT